jgi:hypothetical protein
MSKEDYIKKLITENLEELNDNEPRDGHFDRFESKLKKQNRKRTLNLKLVLKIAASVIFVFLAVNQAIIYFSPEQQEFGMNMASRAGMSLASVSPEYEEVEFYYTNAINVGLNQWEELANQGLISEEEQIMMNSELEEFETVFNQLQNDLETNPNDDRVINAMLEYYQTKLSVINMIVNKLNEVKQQKNTNHEIEM